MNRLDINKELSVASTQLPTIRTSTTAGAAVDLQGFTKAMIVAHIGTIVDGTYAFDVEESDNNSDWNDVAASDLSGAFVNATSAADDTVQVVGYLGRKRYLRVNLTVSGTPSDGGPIAVSVVRGGARTLPV